jgi:DNA-binding IclR family transcriptional regulator
MTSMGKALLASLPDAQVRSLLRGKKLQAQTPNTVSSMKQLLEQLGAIRARGFAINDEETVIGLRSVAATIRDHQGSPIAAVNVAVPSARCTLERLASEVGPRVAEAAEAITAELGYRPPA